MKKLLPLIIFIGSCFLSINLFAEKYAVYFTDKNDTPYSINNPEAFLSQRAIERRARHGILPVVQDLPVNPAYVQALRNLGAQTPFTSRWLNCALVSCTPGVKNQIQNLPFVSRVVYVSPGFYASKGGGEDVPKSSTKFEREADFMPANPKNMNEEYNYGYGAGQITQINGVPVHRQGYTGAGVLIAVLDAGFENVNNMSVFNRIFSEGRLVFAKDVVHPGGNIYSSNTHWHGTSVLSCMAAYTENSFVGTAPKASYALIRTEEDPGEYIIECYNWVIGAELADSIGADIINSSLGYHDFDDHSMNYTFSQMDGETPVASYAAKCAIERGVFVTVSAGNDNYTDWPWIGTPADTKYAATIGAVDPDGDIAYFSSIGPANAAGDPKPNVCARGMDATIYNTYGSVSSGAGTSFAGPIACGMYACLIQANPTVHPALLRNIVDSTGNRFTNHHIAYGYGIPNFAAALEKVLALIPSSNIMDAPQYAVHFKDKNNSPYSTNNPLDYLSQRAVDRRAKYGIAVTTEDLPVNQTYINSVSMTGAYVRNVSKWSNSVLVYAEESMLNAIRNLDFVEKIVYVKPGVEKCQKYDIHPKWANETYENATVAKSDDEYGVALKQIQQINGVPVHQHGYTGENVMIAVIDGGFQNANQVNGFAHLYETNRIVMERNVVEPNRSIYDETISNHGTLVLSCMGGYLNAANKYIGTAPKASYALIRTEDTPTEYLIEEYFWMIGAEVADSLGADIINSSLGYTTFDDATMNHEHSDMDGKTAISSIAAKMAVERGVFVTNSAGNSYGSETFPWVGSPADAPEALSLGAVDSLGVIASFSSTGPNGAGYPKPDVAARGVAAYTLFPNNNIGTASGTSFSSPITCGMVACVIQAAPTKKPAEIITAIQQSADRYPTHNDRYGYGIPDFEKVLKILGVLGEGVENYTNHSSLIYYPNPTHEHLYLMNDKKIIRNVELYNIMGRLIKNVTINNHNAIVDVKDICKGILFVKVIYDTQESEMIKCVVN